MWAFIAGFLSIPYIIGAIVIYCWLTNSLDHENFIKGEVIGGAFLILLTVIFMSIVRIK